MPQDAACPQCQTAFPVTESRAAFTVACPRCDAEMTVEFQRPAAPPEAGQPHYEVLVRPGPLAPAPAPAAPRRRDIDDDDAPKKKGGSATIVVVSGVLGMLFVLGGLGLTAWVLFDVIDTTPTTTPSRTQAKSNTNQNKGNQNKGTSPNPGEPGKTDFELRPVTEPRVNAGPPAFDLTGPREFPLPDAAARVAVGGNGRYLAVLTSSGRLTCFDVSTGKLTVGPDTKQFGGAPVAAGLSRVAVLEGDNTLQVYDLPNLQRRYEAKLPLSHVNATIAMGSATNGPLLACDPFGEVVLMELGDTEAKPVPGSQLKALEGGPVNSPVRASANGRLFVRGEFNGSPQTALLTESGRRWKTASVAVTAAMPHPDGNSVLGYGLMVRANGQTVGGRAPAGVWYVPGVSGAHFVRLTDTNGTVAAWVHKNYNSPEKEKTAFEVRGGLPELQNLLDANTGGGQPLDQHVFLIPDARVLVTLNRERTKLIVRKVELR